MWIIHQHINPTELHIHFTIEIPTDRQLPFLGHLLTCEEDSSISTSVCKKSTHTQRDRYAYLDSFSHHPQAHKAAVVHTPKSRAESFPSSVLACMGEELRVTTALQSNG